MLVCGAEHTMTQGVSQGLTVWWRRQVFTTFAVIHRIIKCQLEEHSTVAYYNEGFDRQGS